MFNLKKNKPLLVILIIQICILLLAAGNFVLCKSNLYSTTIYPNELNCDEAVVHGDKINANVTNAVAGTVASTDSLDLSRGSYIVYVNYGTDTAGNTIQAYSPNIPAHNFLSGANAMYAVNRTAELTMRVNSPGEVIILVDYCGQGNLEISEISIHETTAMAKQDFLHAIALCLVITLGYYICTIDLSKRKTALALGGIVLLSSYPLLLDYMVVGHDLPYHLLRIDGIKLGLENGVFPVKIHPMLAADYGYAAGVFYGDALLYFPAVLRMLGMPVQNAYQVFVFAVNIATTLIAYYCFKNLFQSNKFGLIGTMLYTLSLYRLLNLYTRAAVGEYCAMIFLPLIFLGLYQIFTQKDARPCWKLAIMPALGLTGIIHTHILSCEMVAIFILLTCIVLIKKTMQPQVLLSLLLTVAFTLLINAGFIVPFVDYYFTEEFIINSSEWGGTSVQNIGLYFAQIFSIFQEGTGGTWSTAAGIQNEFNPGLGVTLSLGFFVCIYYILTTTKEERKHLEFKLILFSFIGSALAIYMSSYLFPWDAIANSCSLGTALVSSLQFPWRFLSIGTVFLTICFCLILKHLSDRKGKTRNLPFMPLAIILLCISTLIGTGWYYHSYLSDGAPYRVYDTYELPSTQLYSCEYFPAGTELGNVIYGRYAASEGIILTGINKTGNSVVIGVGNYGLDGYVEVPLLNYKGYSATIMESGSKLLITNGFNNCIHVDIPAGFEGTLDISFHEPIYWRVAEIISAITIIGLIAIPFINAIRSKKHKATSTSGKKTE